MSTLITLRAVKTLCSGTTPGPLCLGRSAEGQPPVKPLAQRSWDEVSLRMLPAHCSRPFQQPHTRWWQGRLGFPHNSRLGVPTTYRTSKGGLCPETSIAPLALTPFVTVIICAESSAFLQFNAEPETNQRKEGLPPLPWLLLSCWAPKGRREEGGGEGRGEGRKQRKRYERYLRVVFFPGNLSMCHGTG